MTTIVNLSNSPYAANSTPTYTGQIVDEEGIGIPASSLSTLTLTIADTLSGAIINNCDQTNILNTGRGTVDGSGNLTIQLLTGDTDLSLTPGVPFIQRSLVIDFTTTAGFVGRHQANFTIAALAGP